MRTVVAFGVLIAATSWMVVARDELFATCERRTVARVDTRADVIAQNHSDKQYAADTVSDRNAPTPDALRHVDAKYGPWLKTVLLADRDRATTQKLLVAREQFANDFEHPDRVFVLAHLDERLAALLHPNDYAMYQTIKESDAASQALQEFSEGLAHVEPLTDAQFSALLAAKRRQTVLTTLAPHAQRETTRQFLIEVQSELSAGQLQHLHDFEQTETERNRLYDNGFQ